MCNVLGACTFAIMYSYKEIKFKPKLNYSDAILGKRLPDDVFEGMWFVSFV